jgi:hypothetical protein
VIVPHFIRYGEIGEKAGEFLKKHHPSLDLPIPIERIVEFGLGLDIVPMPNLYTDFRINGFLAFDCSAIYVDERQYSFYSEKYRFTLAHEVGHLILHGGYYKDMSWKNMDEYIESIMNMDRERLDRFEVQSNLFAEQVLVPERELREVTREVIKRYSKELEKIDASERVILPYISIIIAKTFEVSPAVIECCINHMGIGLSLTEDRSL